MGTDDLIAKFKARIATSREASNQGRNRLKELRSQGPPPNQLNRINAEIQHAEAEFNHADTILAHLQASEVEVTPLSESEVDDLDTLAKQLDGAIRTDAILSATLAAVSRFMQSAKDINKIVGDHTG